MLNQNEIKNIKFQKRYTQAVISGKKKPAYNPIGVGNMNGIGPVYQKN